MGKTAPTSIRDTTRMEKGNRDAPSEKGHAKKGPTRERFEWQPA
jgi:hypothetical protein